jgi:PIN domain nuclease of toxin-antitoxin system
LVVLDASALLALLFLEPGHEVVREHSRQACMTTVNLAEVLGWFARRGNDAYAVYDQLRRFSLEVVPFTSVQATIAAALTPVTAPVGLSLGDRACLALALERAIPVLTADRTWQSVDVGVEVIAIR